MKLVKRIVFLTALFVLTLPITVFAANIDKFKNAKVASDPEQVTGVIETMINWIFGILLIAAVIIILIAAYTFSTSAGDPIKLKKGRDLILYAVVAIVIAFLAEAVVFLIVRTIGANNSSSAPLEDLVDPGGEWD